MVVIAIVVYGMIISYIEPVFESLCEDKVKSIATIISNQESTIAMNKYQYEELYTIEKDDVGNVVIIKSNVVPINNMISDLTEAIQNRFIYQLEICLVHITFQELAHQFLQK